MKAKKKASKKVPRKPSEGVRKKHRLLRVGEVIKKGDQIWAFGVGPWDPCLMTVGKTFSPIMHKVRREVVKRRGK